MQCRKCNEPVIGLPGPHCASCQTALNVMVALGMSQLAEAMRIEKPAEQVHLSETFATWMNDNEAVLTGGWVH